MSRSAMDCAFLRPAVLLKRDPTFACFSRTAIGASRTGMRRRDMSEGHAAFGLKVTASGSQGAVRTRPRSRWRPLCRSRVLRSPRLSGIAPEGLSHPMPHRRPDRPTRGCSGPRPRGTLSSEDRALLPTGAAAAEPLSR
jgi:hypothetical protein